MKNVVKLLVSQHIPAYTTTSGTLVDAYNNEVEFINETIQEVSAENLGLWGLCSLKKYQRMQRLQKQTGFKMSKMIDVKVSVNNRTELVSTKFSLNIDRLTSLFNTMPELLAEAFTMAPSIGGLTKAKALNYISIVPAKLILAKHAKEQEIEYTDIPALPTSTEIAE